MRACELDGASGDDSSSESLERGSLHLVVTEAVSVGGGAEQRKKIVLVLFSRPFCEGLRRVWTELRTHGFCGRKATLEPKGLEFNVACLSIMFLAVKSWNFVGLISLLFAARSFKNCSGL